MKKILITSLAAVYLLSLPIAFNNVAFAQAPTKTATMSLSNSNGTTVPLDSTREFTVNINVNTGGSQSAGFDTTVTYNATEITYKTSSIAYTSFYNGQSAGPVLSGSGTASKIYFGKQGSSTSNNSLQTVASLVFTVASGITSTTLKCDSYYSGSNLVSQTADNVSVYDSTGSYDLLNAQPADVIFTFTAATTAPDITGLNPTSGTTAGGDSVIITGTNFGTTEDTVAIGGTTVSASNVTWTSNTSITFTTPSHAAGAVYVVVTNATTGLSSGSSDAQAAYTYVVPVSTPTISSLSPYHGAAAGGYQVEINGSNFGTSSGATVNWGGSSVTATWVSSSLIRVPSIPSGTAGGSANVTVTVGGVTSAAVSFSYDSATTDASVPTITNLNPNSGRPDVDVLVTITGTNFEPSGLTQGTVRFGTIQATVIDWTNTQIRVWAPRISGISTDIPYPVTVTRSDGKVAVNYYTYLGSISTGGTSEETVPSGMPISMWLGLIPLNGLFALAAKRWLF